MKAVLLYFCFCSLAWAQSELHTHYRKGKQKCVGEHQITVKSRHSKHGFYIFNYMYSSSKPNNETQIKKLVYNHSYLHRQLASLEEKTKVQEIKQAAFNSLYSSPEKFEDRRVLELGSRSKQLLLEYLDAKRKETQKHHTLAMKEDNVHISNPIPDPVPESRDLVDNHTEIEQVTNDKQKYLTEIENNSLERTPENNQDLIGHHGNIRKWDLDQRPVEFFEDKRRNEFSTGYMTGEIEGSGHHFHDPVDFHHAVTIGNKDHEEDKDYQVLVKEKDTHSGVANNNKPLKHSDIKIGVKENDVIISPEINISMPKKTKAPQRKDYSKVFLKGSTDAPKKQPDKGESNSIDLLYKGKKDRETSQLASHLDAQSNLSTEFLEKIEPIRTGNNYINVSKSSGIKAPHEKSMSNATVYKKEGDEDTLVIRKLDRPMNTSKISKPHEKVETNVDIVSISRVQETNVNKEHKKDGTTEDVITSMSNKHMEVAVSSRKHEKDYGNVDVRGRLINQEVSPDTTNKNQVTLNGKLNSLMGRFEVIAKPPLKGEATFLTRIPDNGRSEPNAKEQSKKITLKVDFANEKSKGDVGFPKAFRKELANREKINRKNYRVTLNDPELNKKSRERFGVTFQDMDNDNKENIHFQVGTGIVAELKKRNTIESSNTEAEYHGGKAALSLSRGSHSNIQHPAHISKNGHLAAQGHFLSTVKKKVPKAGEKSAKVSTGIYRSYAAKQHRRHEILRKKNSQHNKKLPSGRKVHVSDSSQSSESKENSRNDSRQSKDYQNDQLDSYQSSESVEIDLSAERDLSDHHSHVEESMTASQENSKELRSSD